MTSATDPDRTALVREALASIRRGSSSFATASRLFPRETRERVWLLYSWCRAADDLTDGQEGGHGARLCDESAEAPLVRHARLVELTRAALDGDEPLPVPFAALRRLVREVALPRQWLFDHLEGFALDASASCAKTRDGRKKHARSSGVPRTLLEAARDQGSA